VALAGCPAPAHPHEAPARPVTIEIGRAGMALRGVAGDERAAYAALSGGGKTVVEAYRGEKRAWQIEFAGDGGPMAADAGALYAADSVRSGGDPGALLVALDAATGAKRWQLALSSTAWTTIASVAALPDGCVVGGAYAGTLRVGSRVVASAGDSDGFVARIDRRGQLAWLVRLGGNGGDAVQGVAAHGDAVAIAGTFTAGADLLGEPLPAFDERSLLPDAFAAELDASGARKWLATFGGKATDAVAGVALDAHGRALVAATARDVTKVGGSELTARGAADGLVVWIEPDGSKGAAQLLGGSDFDGASAVAARGERGYVAGFFSGAMRLGNRALSAGGGDDSYVAAIDGDGNVIASWQIGGEGREEIVGLAAIPGGFVAGVAHTAAAAIDGGTRLPAPADPMTGAALIVRGL
jgi:outer membrane protein assembly factor BamB